MTDEKICPLIPYTGSMIKKIEVEMCRNVKSPQT